MGVVGGAVASQGVVDVNKVRLIDVEPTTVIEKSPVALGSYVVATKTYRRVAKRLRLI